MTLQTTVEGRKSRQPLKGWLVYRTIDDEFYSTSQVVQDSLHQLYGSSLLSLLQHMLLISEKT